MSVEPGGDRNGPQGGVATREANRGGRRTRVLATVLALLLGAALVGYVTGVLHAAEVYFLGTVLLFAALFALVVRYVDWGRMSRDVDRLTGRRRQGS